MKKLLSAAFIWLFAIGASAQSMIGYNLKTTQTTLNPITDGTTVDVGYSAAEFAKLVMDGDGNANVIALEPGTQGYPIGFDFPFNGKKMNQFAIGTDGQIFLGKDQVGASAQSNPFLTFKNDSDNIGMVFIGGTWGLDDTQISYKTATENGSNVLYIQYANLGIADRFANNAVAKVNILYTLYGNGDFKIQLGNFKPFDGASMKHVSMKIGIHGSGNDRLMLANYAGDVTTTDKLISYSSTSYPADGTTYTFVAPPPCETPTQLPTNVEVSPSTYTLSGTFTPSDADSYLVLVDANTSSTASPVDGTAYEVGDSIGTAMVLACVNRGEFTGDDESNPLLPMKNYNVRIWPFNSKCLNGPLYAKTAYSLTTKTLAEAPQVFETDVDTLTFALRLKTNQGQSALIAITDKQAQSNWGDPIDAGVFGNPNGNYAVGDTLDGGAKVVYVGDANDHISLNGIVPGTNYYVRAWSTDGKGHYSSVYADAKASTALKEPYRVTDFTDTPAGWTTNGEARWGTEQSDDGTYYFYGQLSQYDETIGNVLTITTPPVFIKAENNRLIANIALSKRDGWDWGNYTLEEGDTLAVQATADGENYENILLFEKDSEFPGDAQFNSYNTQFNKFSGKSVWFRIYFRTHSSAKIQVSKFVVEEKPEIDYPVNLRDSVISADTAIVTWTPQGTENEWELSYRKAGTEEWSENISVESKPFAVLTGLEGTTKYEFRVRAVAGEKRSTWSENGTFKSGYALPFNEVFAEETSEPTDWKSHSGKLATPSVLSESHDFSFSNYGTASMRFSHRDSICYCWLVSPKFVIEADKYDGIVANVGLTMSYLRKEEPNLEQELYLVISRDGETFNEGDAYKLADRSVMQDNAVLTLTSDTIKGYEGTVRVAVYVTTNETASPVGFTVDNIGVEGVSAVPDAINAVDLKENNVEAYYNAAGQRMSAPQRGLNIIRFKDGKTKKVIIR